jgi:hypothetical protein
MKFSIRVIIQPMLALAVLLAAAGTALASDEKPADEWGYNLSLYIWVPSLDGTLAYNKSGGDPGQEVDAGALIDSSGG